jgi:hypothetical protein
LAGFDDYFGFHGVMIIRIYRVWWVKISPMLLLRGIFIEMFFVVVVGFLLLEFFILTTNNLQIWHELTFYQLWQYYILAQHASWCLFQYYSPQRRIIWPNVDFVVFVFVLLFFWRNRKIVKS